MIRYSLRLWRWRVFSWEVEAVGDDEVFISQTGGQFERAGDPPLEDEEYEYAPDDPEGGFGFRSRQ